MWERDTVCFFTWHLHDVSSITVSFIHLSTSYNPHPFTSCPHSLTHCVLCPAVGILLPDIFLHLLPPFPPGFTLPRILHREHSAFCRTRPLFAASCASPRRVHVCLCRRRYRIPSDGGWSSGRGVGAPSPLNRELWPSHDPDVTKANRH